MTEINSISGMYQFIAKKMGEADSKEAFIEEVDTINKDGYISYDEFSQYVEKWSGQDAAGVSSIIDQFWAKFDKQVNGKIGDSETYDAGALNDKEFANLQKQAELYQKAATEVDKLGLPSELVEYGLREDLVEKLAAYLNKNSNKTSEEIQEFILTKIKTLAVECAKAYAMDAHLDTIKGLKSYDYTLDTDLNTAINAAINDVTGDNAKVLAEKILNKVKETVDNYVENSKNVSNAENTMGEATKLQKAFIESELINKMVTALIKELGVTKLNDVQQAEVEKIAAEIVKGAKKDDTVANFMGDWQNADAYKNLKNYLTFMNDYTNLNDSTNTNKKALIDEIKKKFGEELGNRLIGGIDLDYAEQYQAILNEVAELIKKGDETVMGKDGKIDHTKVRELIADKLLENVSSLFGNTNGLPVDTLINIYNSNLVHADEIRSNGDTNKALNLYRDNFKSLLTALEAKGQAYSEAIIEAFNQKLNANYNSVNDIIFDINSANINIALAKEVIKNLVKEGGAIDSIVTPDEVKLDDSTWGSGDKAIPPQITIDNLNEAKYFTLEPKFLFEDNSKEANIDSSRVSYKSSNSLISISDDGKVSIKSLDKKGNYNATISILVDGVVVGSKKISVICKGNFSLKDETDAKIGDKTISEIICNKATSSFVLSDFCAWDLMKQKAISTVTAKIKEICTALKDTNRYDNAKLEYATNTLINYYTKGIEAITDQISDKNPGEDKEVTFNYTDANGKEVNSEKLKYRQRTYVTAGSADDARGLMPSTTSSGLQLNEAYNPDGGENTSSDNQYKLWLNLGVLLEKFQEFYNMAP